ncbi:mucoidy inhibitor MuiA family protein [Nannocystis sp. RBIL2]|uniref:mucoidy inhibitor MuiA family protein n=1 Tax=Nannocystis sp. RBIL2 TaxID=2996788 RepID=UPI00226E58D0|nr:mucoidy inhibitor MuiA family protein [Nannocystis sp. RBIL2]MCY1066057.1 mucoidy inhibitor MuiA family protein [Nannocystis sp. RBIL2]
MNVPVLTSRIDSVTVYRQGALVCRSAILLAAQPVPPQVKLLGLPLSLDDGSVRVRVEGEGGELPVAMDLRIALDLAVPDPALPPPDDAELKQARREVRSLADRRAHLEAQRARIERLQVYERPANKRGQPPLQSPTSARLALIEFQQQQIAALDVQLQQLRSEQRQAEERREHLEARRKAASKARQAKPHELRKAALISLRAHEVPLTPVRLIFEYMVPGARWAPAYAVSLTRDMARATVAVRAVVAQDTGEDWTGVRLTLATADAQRWVELPEMQALRIGRRQPPVQRRGWRAPPAGAGELYADYDRFLAGGGPRQRKPTPEPAPSDEWTDYEASGEIDGAAADMPRAVTQSGTVSPRESEVLLSLRQQLEQARSQAPPPGGPQPERLGAARPTAPPMRSAPPPAPPPPPSAAAPQAMTFAAERKSSGFGGALAGAVGSLFGGPEGGGGGAPRGGLAHPEAEPEHEAAPEQLAYGDLRMPGPEASRRGVLTLSHRRERYLEMLWVREVTREIDVVSLIDGAVTRAQQAGGRGLPPRHRFAESWFGFDYVYAAETPIDIPSDGDYHSIPLLKQQTPIQLGYVVVPRESTDVYRFVKLKNPLDAPLLPGPADIYVGGDYLLSADLKVAPPRGEVQIGLGVEQAIKVSRNTHYKEEAAGLMGGSLSLRHDIEVEVANRSARPVDVEVQERLPSLREREDEIQVDVGAVEPAWAPFEPEHYELKGGYRWRVQVPAGQQKKLSATYVVRISAKKELVGGNRRE